jgi:hypothetical protein
MSLHPLEERSTAPVDDLSAIPVVPLKPKNKQLFENSPAQESESAQSYSQNRLRLAGDGDPNLAILRERPEHRLMLYLKAAGHSNADIAKMTGYSYNHVCQIVRQPWFREAFVELAHEEGVSVVDAFLQGEVIDSLEVLKSVRDDPEAKDSDRITACREFLDRALGKPVAFVKTENRNVAVSAESDQLDREINTIEEQLKTVRSHN